MKKIITLFFLGLLLASSAKAQQWTALNSNTIQNINDVSFVDENNGWICGRQGNILHTTDGGQNWQYQRQALDSELSCIFFVDALNGWCSGFEPASGGSMILHTTDGGETWTEQNLPTYMEHFGLFFIDSQKGWAVGGKVNVYPNVSTDLEILTTNNGGETWQVQLAQDFAPVQRRVYFIDENVGFSIGDGGIMKTTNGGNNWFDSYNSYNQLTDIFFEDENFGWAVGFGVVNAANVPLLLRTSDGGATWTSEYFTDYENEIFNGVRFTDSLNGWAVGGKSIDDRVMRTYDGGETWVEETTASGDRLSKMVIAGNQVWAVGRNGFLITTTALNITGINEVEEDVALLVYPNPASQFIKISVAGQNNSDIREVSIFSVTGQRVYSDKIAGEHVINIENLIKGVYFVQASTNNGASTMKLIVK
jgi:photosystem II stability/assembly factor-like uncharacterized protein